MNKEESLALFARGREAWNGRAAERFAERERLEEAGEWTADRASSEWTDATRAWVKSASADFSQHKFENDAIFRGFVFPDDARFDGASFSGVARFDGASFSGVARFGGASFSGVARFDQSVFEGFTAFDGADFAEAVSFRAMDGRTEFSLAGATFGAVPDFTQAHFAEAPRLDHLRIQPGRFGPFTVARVKAYFKGDADLSARWRALKRLALQGHDHEREQTFFKGELKSRRWCMDKPWHAAFWFGVVYQLLSDFGRSLVRPVLWWGAGVVGFACLYGIYTAAAAAPGQLPARFLPVIPDGIAFLGLVQVLYSAVLIFLFLLALRNHFRIK